MYVKYTQDIMFLKSILGKSKILEKLENKKYFTFKHGRIKITISLPTSYQLFQNTCISKSYLVPIRILLGVKFEHIVSF